jgi:hypothetical protein
MEESLSTILMETQILLKEIDTNSTICTFIMDFYLVFSQEEFVQGPLNPTAVE